VSVDKLKYDSTGAGEFVHGGVGVDFAAPGGNSKDPASNGAADASFADNKGGVTGAPGGQSGSPSGFARPGGAEGI